MPQADSRSLRPKVTLLEDRTVLAGALDPSFGTGGLVTTTYGTQSVTGRAVCLDQLGRTLVAGFTDSLFVVARYRDNGSLDTTFAGTGIVTIDFSPSGGGVSWAASAYAIALDSNARIVVAGTATSFTSVVNVDFAVARLLDSGALDTSFNGNGKRLVDFGYWDFARSVAIDSLERIVIGGYHAADSMGTGSRFEAARLLPTGALDSSFGVGGKQFFDFGGFFPAYNAMSVDYLDRVIISGRAQLKFQGASDFGVARLTSAGFLDPSFNGDGRKIVDFDGAGDAALAVTTDPQGRVVVAGVTNYGTNSDVALARLTTDGALDVSFGSNGKFTVDFDTSNDSLSCVALDSIGNIVIGGSRRDTTLNKNLMAVARLTSAGSLDIAFGSDGKQTIDFSRLGGLDEIAYSLDIASGNRVVIAGTCMLSLQSLAVARLTGETTTAAAQINDGSVQRSRIISLTVRFSGQVTFDGTPIQAFGLMRTGGGSVTLSATVSAEFGGTVVTLSNFNGPESEFGSLRDGRYTLTALASQISAGGQPLDGDADGTPGGNYTFGEAQGLFRFFGDINGDRRVNIADYGLFSLSYLNAANYVAGFDFNGDGRINIADYGQFALRYLIMLP